MFRYKKSIPVSYEWQGYIYFTSLLYWELPKRTQEKILNLCIAAGKENYQALFEFVTTDAAHRRSACGTTSPPLRWNEPCGDTTRRSHGRFDMQATGSLPAACVFPLSMTTSR